MFIENFKHYEKFFEDREEEALALALIDHLIYGTEVEITPAIWQDAEVFVRYKNRNVWSLDDNQLDNAHFALLLFKVKYITENLDNNEISKLLNDFFAQDGEDFQTFTEIIQKKFLAPIDDLICAQEKRVVTKKDLKDFDSLFAYPAWLEFDDEALDAVYKKIMDGKMSDEQIDYFLGADDDIKDYAKIYPVVKHVLLTTKNAHTFWTAGDVLSIIWRTAPRDEKSQKWFRDEIFEIFWPRVGGVWPIAHAEYIDDEEGTEGQILMDSINWLLCLEDLGDRVELPKSEEILIHPPNPDLEREELIEDLEDMTEDIKSGEVDAYDALDFFLSSAEDVEGEECLEKLKEAGEALSAALKEQKDTPQWRKNAPELVAGAIKHAEMSNRKMEQERKNIKKKLVK